MLDESGARRIDTIIEVPMPRKSDKPHKPGELLTTAKEMRARISGLFKAVKAPDKK